MIFRNRLVLSAMAGINNSEFAKKHKVGLAILGGFNADKETNKAALKVVNRKRKEFIFKNPLREIEKEIKNMEDFNGKVGVNIRAFSVENYVKVAKIAGDYDAIVEINAHCRQKEFTDIGCGQSLLFSDRIYEIVEKCSKFSKVSVKIRGGLNLDYEVLAEKLFEFGASFLHVDAMISGGKADYNLIKKISGFGNIIGNNSVVDVNSALRMLKSGAKLVSAARAVLRDPLFFDKLLKDELLASKVVI